MKYELHKKLSFKNGYFICIVNILPILLVFTPLKRLFKKCILKKIAIIWFNIKYFIFLFRITAHSNYTVIAREFIFIAERL